MKLLALPAFADNYIWMLHDGRQALVVDPGESAPVEQALDAHGLRLSAILVTHHHGDHVGGVDALRPRLEGPVYGPAREKIPPPFTALRDGDAAEWLGLRFSGGCGRLFEGTPAQMHRSLSRLAALPGDTRVCCAHEYTLSNLKFARAVEPHNRDLLDYTAQCEALRADGRATLPSSIAQERRINPFMRCAQPEVAAAAATHGARPDDEVDVLAALRHWKNNFR
jgi:hydroxyacylglutathione hydrolase